MNYQNLDNYHIQRDLDLLLEDVKEKLEDNPIYFYHFDIADGRATIALVVYTDNNPGTGGYYAISFCCPFDNFSRKVGKIKSLQKLLNLDSRKFFFFDKMTKYEIASFLVKRDSQKISWVRKYEKEMKAWNTVAKYMMNREEDSCCNNNRCCEIEKPKGFTKVLNSVKNMAKSAAIYISEKWNSIWK